MSAPPTAKELSAIRRDRLGRIREAMAELEIDCCLLSNGADLPWCIGYEAMPLERPTVLIITNDQDPTLVVPAVEAGRVNHDPELFTLRSWDDSEDAIAIICGLIGTRRRLAIADHARATLLLHLQRALSGGTWQAASKVTGPIRAVKDRFEIAALRAAAHAADRVATDLVTGHIGLIGRSEIDVSRDISARLIAEGHTKVNFAIVGSGPNAASPHHEPGDRVIGANETVVCDFGGAYELGEDIGYCSDITRTVVTGEPSSEIAETYAVLEYAQQMAVAAVQPGVSCASIDRTGRALIAEAGLGEHFIHRIGHGIGAEAHEDPYIIESNDTILQPGHAFSVEPGIYLAGRFGARIEDIVVVTKDGVDALNVVDHELCVVEA